MRFYNKEEAISRINRFSKENDPFIFIIDYLQNNSIVEKICDIDCDTILFDFNGFSNSANRPDNLSDNKPELISHPLSFEEYEKSFHIVKNNILSGNSFLTNLTCRTPIEINMSMKDIFFRSKALYKLWIKDSFVVFSPEIFVRIENNMISSFPMKGTIHAEITDAEKTLMHDRK